MPGKKHFSYHQKLWQKRNLTPGIVMQVAKIILHVTQLINKRRTDSTAKLVQTTENLL